MIQMSFNIFPTYCAAQRKEIAVKAFMEFLNRCKDLTGIFTAVMSFLLDGGRGGGILQETKPYNTNGRASTVTIFSIQFNYFIFLKCKIYV